MGLTQLAKNGKETTLSSMDQSSLESNLKKQTMVGLLIRELADTLLDASLTVAEEDFAKYGYLLDTLTATYLSLKINGDYLYDDAVRMSNTLDLKSPEDSMWGN